MATFEIIGSFWQFVVIYGNQWQSVLNFYLFLLISIKFLLIDNQYQPERRRREGQQRMPHNPTGCLKKNRVLANMDMVDMMFLFCWFIILFWSFLSKTKGV